MASFKYIDRLSAYRDFHYKDKTVMRSWDLYDWNPHTGDTAFFFIETSWLVCLTKQKDNDLFIIVTVCSRIWLHYEDRTAMKLPEICNANPLLVWQQFHVKTAPKPLTYTYIFYMYTLYFHQAHIANWFFLFLWNVSLCFMVHITSCMGFSV